MTRQVGRGSKITTCGMGRQAGKGWGTETGQGHLGGQGTSPLLPAEGEGTGKGAGKEPSSPTTSTTSILQAAGRYRRRKSRWGLGSGNIMGHKVWHGQVAAALLGQKGYIQLHVRHRMEVWEEARGNAW